MVQMTILAAAVAVVSFFSLGPRRKFVGKPPFSVTSLSRLVLLGSVPLRSPLLSVPVHNHAAMQAMFFFLLFLGRSIENEMLDVI